MHELWDTAISPEQTSSLSTRRRVRAGKSSLASLQIVTATHTLVLYTVVSAMSTIRLWLRPVSYRANLSTAHFFWHSVPSTAPLLERTYPYFRPRSRNEFGVQNFASINGLLHVIRDIRTLIGAPIAGSLIHRHSGPSSHLASSFERTSLMVWVFACWS
jgi:hypothetical protein